MKITNEEFLRAIFGEQYVHAHVCSFPDDPSSISNDRKGMCWAGGYLKDTPLQPNTNQFYTVSLFAADDDGKSKRRKVNFGGQYVVALDDVKEKLPIEQVSKLPEPSIILKSSNHSEQWLYILETPELSRDRLDNLHDQLITNGLSPDSTDPGQKGVSRYMRLPEGVNTKAKRIEENGGVAPQCEVTLFEPTRKHTMESLAQPFGVDLDRDRASTRVDGAVEIADHPVLQKLQVKSVISPGRVDITCPWVADHTDGDDSGTAVFTNNDGTVGFQCHHGHCQEKNAGDLLDYIEESTPGFKRQYSDWKAQYIFRDMVGAGSQNSRNVGLTDGIDADGAYNALIEELKTTEGSQKRVMAEAILKGTDQLPRVEKHHWHEQVRDVMGWTKADMAHFLTDFRIEWYGEGGSMSGRLAFYGMWVFVSSLNAFYCSLTGIFLTPEAFQNSFAHLDEDARLNALTNGLVQKVDSIDYAPKMPPTFVENHTTYTNTWRDHEATPVQGDCSTWLDHFDRMGLKPHKKHMMQWMACTLLQQEKKINHALVLAGLEGIGKDFLLYPMMQAMGRNSKTAHGTQLTSQFNEYAMNAKHLHFNEVEMGDHKDATMIAAKLKHIIAAPPHRITINKKGIAEINVRNIVNVSLTSNSTLPVHVSDNSRR